MKVTFIIHSSFLIELDSCALLFDYYQGPLPPTAKPLYVFASHCHPDHFSPSVLQFPASHFILSNDIWPSRVPDNLKPITTFVAPRKAYQIDNLKIATLQSTDQGVAFLIDCDGKLIYHAGDLNCWVWDGAPRYQNDQMTQIYKDELKLLDGKEIDVAFVPLDPRQDADFDLGMKYFFEAAGAKHVFPMHMWDDYSVVPLFKSTPTYRDYAPAVMDITGPGQTFEIE